MKKYIIGTVILLIVLAGLYSVNGQTRPRLATICTEKVLNKKGKVDSIKVCPTLYGNGLEDDTNALLAWSNGEKVIYRGEILGNLLQSGRFLISRPIRFIRPNSVIRYNLFIRKYPNVYVTYGGSTRFYGNETVKEIDYYEGVLNKYKEQSKFLEKESNKLKEEIKLKEQTRRRWILMQKYFIIR